MTQWTLAIDFGTSSTSAAFDDGEHIDILEVDNSRYLPSVVFLTEGGEMATGRSAMSSAGANPERAVLLPKRALATQEYIRLAGESVATVDLASAVLRRMADEAQGRFGKVAPARLLLTHPARWGATEQGALADAAAAAGLPDPELVPEPVAAASYYATRNVPVGACVAVYDLGGGTYDTAVLRRTESGFELLAIGGSDEIGGEDFDDELERIVGLSAAQVDADVWHAMQDRSNRAATRAAWRFHNDVRFAKEELSRFAQQTIVVFDRLEVNVTRAELEKAVGEDVDETVTEFLATVERSGVALADLKGVYLVGGASRMPLVSDLLTQALGRVPDLEADPKCVVVEGSLLWARRVPQAPPRPRPWRYTDAGGATQRAPLATAAGVVVVSEEGTLSLLDTASGAIRWQKVLEDGELDGGGMLHPVGYRDLVVIGSQDGGVRAYRIGDGTPVWHVRSDVLSAPPAVSGDLVVVSGMTGTMALDARNGGIRWRYLSQSPAFAAPTVYGDLVVVCHEDGRVVALERDKGKARWTCSFEAEVWAPGVGFEDLLIFGDAAGDVHALDVQRGVPRWVHRMPSDMWSTPIVHGGGLYVCDSTGTVRLLEAASGVVRQSWSVAAGLRDASALLIGEQLCLPDTMGSLTILDTTNGRSRSLELTSVELSSCVTDRGVIFVAGGSSVFAVDPRPRAPKAVAL
ncbi:PQQ-binding-like beta-propeller repeat protein [Dactylosporangium sp. AC04546]|uniref:hsp70 family protein n=1 Tax=Dactylosporangium sp. AC04546 TaxID=2862460 RepID=UPI001EDD9F1A|nr:hsp70 family protein [Dactylosporangium sp. AC04546]WVK87008.1 PQQ-binding-like beta-propeller repeat protein [Dactylosporangium sp. AC04546]